MTLSPRRRRAADAWDAWLQAAGDWRRWAIGLPLLGPGLDEIAGSAGHYVRPSVPPQLTDALERAARTQPTLLVLDLPPVLGVTVAIELARRGAATPLLLLGRWPYAQAILPAQPLVDVLRRAARRLPPDCQAASVALVLDGERSRPLASRRASDTRADNRYVYFAEDLPDANAVRAGGMRRVLDVRLQGSTLEPDSPGHSVYAAYRAAGLPVEPFGHLT